MSRPPLARERVLDAFETVLLAEGERGATLDATAREAGVSKGGLLYHFASKEALVAGLLERMKQRAATEMTELEAAPEGIIAAFMRSSVHTGSPLDRSIVATTRLAQNGHPDAGDALRGVREIWEGALRPHTRDDAALQLVMLVSDGLYFNNALADGAVPGPELDDTAFEALVALVRRAAS